MDIQIKEPTIPKEPFDHTKHEHTPFYIIPKQTDVYPSQINDMCGYDVHTTNTLCQTHGGLCDFRTVVYFCDHIQAVVISAGATCQGRKRADWPYSKTVTGDANADHVYRDCDRCQPIEQAWMDEGLAIINKDYETGRLFINYDHKMDDVKGMKALNIRLSEMMETQMMKQDSREYNVMLLQAVRAQREGGVPKGFKKPGVEDIMEKLCDAVGKDEATKAAVAKECSDDVIKLAEDEVEAMIDLVINEKINKVNAKIVPEARYVS